MTNPDVSKSLTRSESGTVGGASIPPGFYGYRPGKSALDAVGMARQRCWRRDWVLDLDIKAFFDSIDTELLMRAVRKHTDCPWALLYIDRWLKASVRCRWRMGARKGSMAGMVGNIAMSVSRMENCGPQWPARLS